jgi:cell division protein FtsB
MKNRIKWLEKEISRLKEENHLLEKEKRELNSDPYRVEMEARKLGMVREGEWVVEFRPKRR